MVEPEVGGAVVGGAVLEPGVGGAVAAGAVVGATEFGAGVGGVVITGAVVGAAVEGAGVTSGFLKFETATCTPRHKGGMQFDFLKEGYS